MSKFTALKARESSSCAERAIHLTRQKRPERFERTEINLRGPFQIRGRQSRVIHFRGEMLFTSRVERWRKRAADIAAHDLRARHAQLRQRPRDIFHRELAALPARDGLLR